VSEREIFDAGKLVSKQFYDDAGNVVADTTITDRGASFAGGVSAWQKYLYKQLYFPTQWKIENSDIAVVVVDAVIDEDGNVTDVSVNTPFHPDFDRIAVQALKKSPRWIPAIQHYRFVKYKIRQAVSFQQLHN
jgi:outer membrane biosynthesis protein TonB